MKNFNTYKELIKYIPSDEPIVITGHMHPDGDCIGATLGLYNILKEKYNVCVVLEERLPNYDYLTGFNEVVAYEELNNIKETTDNDYTLIVMDCGDRTRIEPVDFLFEQAKTTVNIDHHESNTYYGMYNFVDTKASSTAEMVGFLIGMVDGNKELLTKEVAECLYTGIIYDTGVFKHTNTRKETLNIAADLVDMGINYNEMINRLFFTRTLNSVKAMHYAFESLELANDGQIAFAMITYDQLKGAGLKKSDTEKIVNFINEIEGPVASAFLLELEPGEFKGSFRSKDWMNVCNVAKVFGGGGHIKAAGCSIDGSKEDVTNRVLKELRLEFQRNN